MLLPESLVEFESLLLPLLCVESLLPLESRRSSGGSELLLRDFLDFILFRSWSLDDLILSLSLSLSFSRLDDLLGLFSFFGESKISSLENAPRSDLDFPTCLLPTFLGLLLPADAGLLLKDLRLRDSSLEAETSLWGEARSASSCELALSVMAMFQVTAAPTRFRRLEGDGIVSGRSEPPIVRGMREIFVRTVAVGREWQSLKAVTCHRSVSPLALQNTTRLGSWSVINKYLHRPRIATLTTNQKNEKLTLQHEGLVQP